MRANIRMKSTSPFSPGSSVIAYLRDSGGADQDLSVDQQKAEIETWCLENHLILSHVFADVHRPGSSTVGRFEFENMLNHFRTRPPDAGLVLWTFSRFARDLDDAQFFKAEIRSLGYVIHSLQDEIPEGLGGRLIEFVKDMTNQQYLLDLSRDIKRGLHFMVKTYGGVPGVPPRGFMREPVTIGKRVDGALHVVNRWVPDPVKFPLVQKAWQMRANGASIQEIHTAVPIYGSIAAWGSFFSNRIYLGELRFGDQVIPNYVPAAATQEMWDRVHSYRPRRVKKDGSNSPDHPRRVNSTFLLSGLLYCKKCQQMKRGDVRLAKGITYYYYVCNRQYHRGSCPDQDIRREVLEQAIVKEILDQVLEINHIRKLIGEHKGMDTIPREIKTTEAALSIIKRKIDNLIDAIADRGMDAKLNARLDELEAEQTARARDLAVLKSASDRGVNYDESQIELILNGMRKALESDDIKNQREALKTFIRRILVYRNGDEISCDIEYIVPSGSPGGGGSCGFVSPLTRGACY